MTTRLAAIAMSVAAVVGIAISAYLTWVKISGGQPYCGPIVGCETVNTSPYSEVFGIPVAVFGLGVSTAILVGVVAWWRNNLRQGLLLAYVLGLVSLPILGYLTYLELFVIHAICVWCVGYAITVLIGWALAAWAMTRPVNSADQANAARISGQRR